jgi:hypothetical protein
MTDTGTGYLQQNFKLSCPGPKCQFNITHKTLGIAKLVHDLAMHRHATQPQGLLASVSALIFTTRSLILNSAAQCIHRPTLRICSVDGTSER